MRQPLRPATSAPSDQPARMARAGLGDCGGVRAACGHARYTKGCDLCALAGIYRDHLGRPGLTAGERATVIGLYLAGDKAGLFKLWRAFREDVS